MQYSSSAAEDNECPTQLSFYAGAGIQFNSTARVECFAGLKLHPRNFDLLSTVFQEALKQQDLAAVKGLAKTFAENMGVANSD